MRTAEPVAMRTVGEVAPAAIGYVRQQIEAAVGRMPAVVSEAAVKLVCLDRRVSPWPVMAQAVVVADGTVLRAQVVADFFHHAGWLLRRRLRAAAARLATPLAFPRWPDSQVGCCHPQPPSTADGKLVRTKECELAVCTPDEAAVTMDLRDYDAHLFVDADSGQDSVLSRVGPTGYRLTRLNGLAPPRNGVVAPLTIDVHPVPTLTVADAMTRLHDTAMAYRFFRCADTDRGAVLHRRYDGNFTLLQAPVTRCAPGAA